ncbi:glucokinase [Epibacterium ulvae]|uniref:Glucokinase n=2 Tax=Epibacterium ulvae TaxID=1156985 RepID=A0A1G5RAT0_9RHOB|nr:ROK family protein [Epibacterium ulvae]SCZ71202.1 glucokinase [Epibacterium ulvae]
MWNLIGDVGGTNMRLAAVSSDGEILEQRSFPSKGDVPLEEVCRSFVSPRDGAPGHVVIAAAGVVKDGQVTLTNARQTASESGIAAACGTGHAKILNDFEAAAWSLATVGAEDVTVLQGTTQFQRAPRLIIGPGTGLGVGSLIYAHGQPAVVPGEGGHVAIAPRRADLVAVFDCLTRDWPEVAMGAPLAVEAEALLSGTGLPRFYRALAEVRGAAAVCVENAEIFAAAQTQSDAVAVEAVALFAEYLGAVAGDLGLVLGATGGVFVTGGLALKNPWMFDTGFLEAFNAGGRHQSWREAMPVYLYSNEDFGLIGARNYLMTL